MLIPASSPEDEQEPETGEKPNPQSVNGTKIRIEIEEEPSLIPHCRRRLIEELSKRKQEVAQK